MTAREIAKDFISTMNPSGWDGIGQKPNDCDGKCQITYQVDGYPNINVNIYCEHDLCDNVWWNVCEAYDSVTGDKGLGVWVSSIKFASGLEDSIKYLFDKMNITL